MPDIQIRVTKSLQSGNLFALSLDGPAHNHIQQKGCDTDKNRGKISELL